MFESISVIWCNGKRRNYFAVGFLLILVNIYVLNGIVLIDNNEFNSSNSNKINYMNDYPLSPEPSDVAGSEVYSEQISVFAAGRSSVVRQSYVTNDSNIFKNFDYNDPGFLECSLFIAASNGISPSMYPFPYGE
ncbi:MAG: hypothetical protein GF364_11235 [Candidatus Lokiarchaeota archaeon]|nr:hypothetical protein [Candidatus Lokiarchaeota archaeon]